MTFVFFSLSELGEVAAKSALKGGAVAGGGAVAYNTYRSTVHPYTSEERDALNTYKQSSKEYGLIERTRDALPKLRYTQDGEEYISAKTAREDAIKARQERISPLNVKNLAITGGLIGAGLGIRHYIKRR